jgi:hypothetical protein
VRGQVLMAIMSGVFGLAGWHFCKLQFGPHKCDFTDILQPETPPALPRNGPSPRQKTASPGRRVVVRASTSTTREAISMLPRRTLLQH